MKTIKLFTISFLLSFTFSCDDDNNIGVNTISTTIEDLHAPQEGGQGQTISGPFTKFDFESGSEKLFRYLKSEMIKFTHDFMVAARSGRQQQMGQQVGQQVELEYGA